MLEDLSRFQHYPDPLGAEVVPAEAVEQPAYGSVSAWIDAATRGPPSAGRVGRMELLKHWTRLPAERRKLVLLLAREMTEAETG